MGVGVRGGPGNAPFNPTKARIGLQEWQADAHVFGRGL